MKLFKSAKEIEKALEKLAREIDDYYGKTPLDRPVLAVCLLKGAIYFYADLTRKLKTEIELDFVQTSSYGSNRETSGAVRILTETRASVAGRRVLIVDDVVDSGLTLNRLKRRFQAQGAQDVKIVALVDKPARRQTNLEPDFHSFDAEDLFLVGYGMDDAESERELPDIWYID